MIPQLFEARKLEPGTLLMTTDGVALIIHVRPWGRDMYDARAIEITYLLKDFGLITYTLRPAASVQVL